MASTDTGGDTVTIRNPNKDAFDFEDRVREVTISCPDATGLGVDITRVLLDFGLRIVHADMITDCSWCFLVLTLKLIDLGVPARWKLLKRRLEGSCPKDVDALYQLSGGMIDRNSDCEPYIVTVTGQDREGMLHVLMNSFWEADCAVFRAKIETHEGGIVQDMFWIYDNKKKLPSEDRVMEVSDRVVGVLGGDVECSIARAPAHEVVAPRNIIAAVSGLYGEEPMRRLACKDAVSHSNLRELISGEKKHARRGSSSDSLSSFDTHSPGSFPSFGRLSHFLTSKIRLEEFSKYQDVVVDVDTETSSDFIILEVKCQDRKGLLYDIFLQLKEIRVRVAACRMNLMEDKRARVVVTLQDAYGGDMCSSSQAIPLLVQRLKEAVASPLQILLADGSNPRQALLSIVAPVDAGGRGRPRVTFDVTRVLTSAGLMISEADVYIEDANAIHEENYEVHTFLINKPEWADILSSREKKYIMYIVKACLEGNLTSQILNEYKNNTGEGRESQSDLLRALSTGWKEGLDLVHHDGCVTPTMPVTSI